MVASGGFEVSNIWGFKTYKLTRSDLKKSLASGVSKSPLRSLENLKPWGVQQIGDSCAYELGPLVLIKSLLEVERNGTQGCSQVGP